jgi:hypothetical protein
MKPKGIMKHTIKLLKDTINILFHNRHDVGLGYLRNAKDSSGSMQQIQMANYKECQKDRRNELRDLIQGLRLCQKFNGGKMIKFHILDENDNPVFDLINGKHGYSLDSDGKINEVGGVRIMVPMLDINDKTLSSITRFIDDMEGTAPNPDVTIVIKKSESAKIGIFATKIGVFAIGATT